VGTLRPLTLEPHFLPTVAIDLAVQRKQAIQDYTIYCELALLSERRKGEAFGELPHDADSPAGASPSLCYRYNDARVTSSMA
jgi:hypothetical protein